MVGNYIEKCNNTFLNKKILAYCFQQGLSSKQLPVIILHSVFSSAVYVQSQKKKYIKAFNNSMLSFYTYIYMQR